MSTIDVEITNERKQLQRFFSKPDQADLGVIKSLCEKYPYSKTLWLLYARVSVNKNDRSAQDVYQKAALFCPDEEELRAYVYNKHLPLQEIEKKQSSSEISRIQQIQDSTEEGENSSPSRYMDDWMPYSYVWWLQKTRMEYAGTYQPYASRSFEGSTAQSNKTGTLPSLLDQQIREHIFHLQDPEQKLSEQFDGKAKPFQVPRKENEIIEKFIKEEPQIKPPTAEKINMENKARKSAEDNSGFVSETLAQIYTEQGLHHKAIDTYKKLSLKYPEKSLYFAKLIEELNQKLN